MDDVLTIDSANSIFKELTETTLAVNKAIAVVQPIKFDSSIIKSSQPVDTGCGDIIVKVSGDYISDLDLTSSGSLCDGNTRVCLTGPNYQIGLDMTNPTALRNDYTFTLEVYH